MRSSGPSPSSIALLLAGPLFLCLYIFRPQFWNFLAVFWRHVGGTDYVSVHDKSLPPIILGLWSEYNNLIKSCYITIYIKKFISNITLYARWCKFCEPSIVISTFKFYRWKIFILFWILNSIKFLPLLSIKTAQVFEVSVHGRPLHWETAIQAIKWLEWRGGRVGRPPEGTKGLIYSKLNSALDICRNISLILSRITISP